MNETKEIRLVSIIVICHLRKSFLKGAVESVLSQEITPGLKTEIIVVKDFVDDALDSFLEAHNVMNIFKDGNLGEMLVEGVSSSNGDVICFLDDDDLYAPNKIKAVVWFFSKYPDAEFLSHNCKSFVTQLSEVPNVVVSDQANVIDTTLLGPKEVIALINQRIDFNLSSICVRRSFALSLHGTMMKIKGGPDTFLFLAALQQGTSLIRVHDKLSYYRVPDTEGEKLRFGMGSVYRMRERTDYMIAMLKPFTVSPNQLTRKVAEYLHSDWTLTKALINEKNSRRDLLRQLVNRTRFLWSAFSMYYITKSFLAVSYLFSRSAGLMMYISLKTHQDLAHVN